MGETRDLADFVGRPRFADIPAGTVEKIKVYTLDNLAAGFVGSTTPRTQAVTSGRRRGVRVQYRLT